jgi:hypothetical protein
MRSLFFWHVMQRRLVVTLPTFPDSVSVPKLNTLHCVTSQKNEDLLYILGGIFMLNKPVNYLAYDMVTEWHENRSAVVFVHRVC